MGVTTALGSRLTRAITYHTLLERLVFGCGLGLAVLSLATTALGFAGLLYRWLFWLLLALTGLALWREFGRLAGPIRRASIPRPRGVWPTLLVAFIAATLLLALLALTALVAAPWYLRDTLVTGNPIYPLIWGGQS
jgi:hypothetical protein